LRITDPNRTAMRPSSRSAFRFCFSFLLDQSRRDRHSLGIVKATLAPPEVLLGGMRGVAARLSGPVP
ncbi:MAG TPA: hypothetical protein PLR91_09640, partial [Kiritimatiellia bacterium]|nr:hypothetical protein [Kiritimatiellia bacterium]